MVVVDPNSFEMIHNGGLVEPCDGDPVPSSQASLSGEYADAQSTNLRHGYLLRSFADLARVQTNRNVSTSSTNTLTIQCRSSSTGNLQASTRADSSGVATASTRNVMMTSWCSLARTLAVTDNFSCQSNTMQSKYTTWASLARHTAKYSSANDIRLSVSSQLKLPRTKSEHKTRACSNFDRKEVFVLSSGGDKVTWATIGLMSSLISEREVCPTGSSLVYSSEESSADSFLATDITEITSGKDACTQSTILPRDSLIRSFDDSVRERSNQVRHGVLTSTFNTLASDYDSSSVDNSRVFIPIDPVSAAVSSINREINTTHPIEMQKENLKPRSCENEPDIVNLFVDDSSKYEKLNRMVTWRNFAGQEEHDLVPEEQDGPALTVEIREAVEVVAQFLGLPQQDNSITSTSATSIVVSNATGTAQQSLLSVPPSVYSDEEVSHVNDNSTAKASDLNDDAGSDSTVSLPPDVDDNHCDQDLDITAGISSSDSQHYSSPLCPTEVADCVERESFSSEDSVKFFTNAIPTECTLLELSACDSSSSILTAHEPLDLSVKRCQSLDRLLKEEHSNEIVSDAGNIIHSCGASVDEVSDQAHSLSPFPIGEHKNISAENGVNLSTRSYECSSVNNTILSLVEECTSDQSDPTCQCSLVKQNIDLVEHTVIRSLESDVRVRCQSQMSSESVSLPISLPVLSVVSSPTECCAATPLVEYQMIFSSGSDTSTNVVDSVRRHQTDRKTFTELSASNCTNGQRGNTREHCPGAVCAAHNSNRAVYKGAALQHDTLTDIDRRWRGSMLERYDGAPDHSHAFIVAARARSPCTDSVADHHLCPPPNRSQVVGVSGASSDTRDCARLTSCDSQLTVSPDLSSRWAVETGNALPNYDFHTLKSECVNTTSLHLPETENRQQSVAGAINVFDWLDFVREQYLQRYAASDVTMTTHTVGPINMIADIVSVSNESEPMTSVATTEDDRSSRLLFDASLSNASSLLSDQYTLFSDDFLLDDSTLLSAAGERLCDVNEPVLLWTSMCDDTMKEPLSSLFSHPSSPSDNTDAVLSPADVRHEQETASDQRPGVSSSSIDRVFDDNDDYANSSSAVAMPIIEGERGEHSSPRGSHISVGNVSGDRSVQSTPDIPPPVTPSSTFYSDINCSLDSFRALRSCDDSTPARDDDAVVRGRRHSSVSRIPKLSPLPSVCCGTPASLKALTPAALVKSHELLSTSTQTISPSSDTSSHLPLPVRMLHARSTGSLLKGGECCTDERYNGHQDTGRFRHAPHLSPTGASDEDEVSTHTAALSDTTRSKARLLAKRNEFRREVDRKNQLQQQMRTHGRRGVMNNSMPSLTTGSGAAAGSALHDPAVRPRQTVRSHTLANHRQSGVAAAGKSAGPAAHPTLMKKSKTFGGDLSKSLNASGPSVNLFDGSLTTFASPKAALEMAYVKLASSEWDTAVSGLTDIVRLVRYHPAVIVGDVKTVTAAVVRQCRNLRSQVMRTAIQTTTELFEHIGRALEPELASLVEILMLRTSDTNRFIRADSSRALDVMLEQVSVPRAVACVTHTGVTHRSAQVRCTTARLLAQLVARVGPQRALAPGTVERLIPAAAQLTRQGDLQTRQYAKMIFRELLSHPDLDKILSRHLQDSVYRDIVKLVDNLQNEVNNSHTGAQSRLNQTM